MLSHSMLNKSIYHPNHIQKHQNRKWQKIKKLFSVDNKQNCNSNVVVQRVDITKKIKKRSPKKFYQLIQSNIQKFNGFMVYKDVDIGFEKGFINLTQPLMIDNDVDTDEEQTIMAIQKMSNFLKVGCIERAGQNHRVEDMEQKTEEMELWGQKGELNYLIQFQESQIQIQQIPEYDDENLL